MRVTIRRHLSGEYSIWSGHGSWVSFRRYPSGRATVGRRCGLWKLPVPWTPRARPPLLGKRPERVFHSAHRPLLEKAVRSLVKRKRTDHLLTTDIQGRRQDRSPWATIGVARSASPMFSSIVKITLRWKSLKTQEKFCGWRLGIRTRPADPQPLDQSQPTCQLVLTGAVLVQPK